MIAACMHKVVIDTNVLFEGLTKQGSAAGFVIEAWATGLLQVYVSTALAYEYEDVLVRKLSANRWQVLSHNLAALLNLTYFVNIYYSWRPSSPDPGDDFVIDCAMNAGAIVVTSNVRDFRKAQSALGLRVLTPVELIIQLASEGDPL